MLGVEVLVEPVCWVIAPRPWRVPPIALGHGTGSEAIVSLGHREFRLGDNLGAGDGLANDIRVCVKARPG